MEALSRNKLEKKLRLIDRKPSNEVSWVVSVYMMIVRVIPRRHTNSRQWPSSINITS